MIVDGGCLALLNAQASYLATCIWALFVNNIPDAETNVLAGYTEAGWAGYARVAVGTVNPAILVSPRSSASAATPPSFTNTSGVNQTFYGWMLLDPTGTILLAATNIGLTNLPNGLTYSVAAVFTDRQE